MKFKLSDESVNSYGFRVLTNGIDLSDFKKNPVMFYNHDRRLMPIGKWKNIAIEDGALVAEAEFDENDEFAMQVKEKVDNGFLNATSIGFDVLGISEEKGDMVKGQVRPTVTKSRLFEVSVVDIPSNRNALKLNFPTGVTLSGKLDENYLNHVLPKISEMKELKKKYGLADDASEADVLAAIEKANKESIAAAVKEALKKEATPPKKEDETNTDAVELLCDMAEGKGFDREKIKANAEKDFQLTYDMVKSTPAKTDKGDDGTRLSDVLKELKNQNSDNTPDPVKGKSYSQLSRENPAYLENLLKTKPQEVKNLFKAEFGFEPKDADLGI